jgi:hypothetical protein
MLRFETSVQSKNSDVRERNLRLFEMNLGMVRMIGGYLYNPKSQKDKNETKNGISGSSLVLGDLGCGVAVELDGVCLLRDGVFGPGSNDGIDDGRSEGVGSIHSRLDLFRLRLGRSNRCRGKHWPVHAKALDRRDVRNLPRVGGRANGLHHDHWRRDTGNGTIGTSHALTSHYLLSGTAVVFVVRQE